MPGKKLIIFPGDVYGRLTVLEEVPSRVRASGGTKRWFLCVCDCGRESEVPLANLRCGKTKTCGHHHSLGHREPCELSPEARENLSLRAMERDDYHGMLGSKEHRVWLGVKQRCYRPRAKGYSRYGGRGIVMCSGWKSSFKSFFEDMGERPSLEHSIERGDNDGNYSCGHCEECAENGWTANCRWATRGERRRSAKNIRFLEFRGDCLCLKDMAEKYGMTKGQLHSRLSSGWSLSDALLTPVREWKADGT